jgi:hypothetical protein
VGYVIERNASMFTVEIEILDDVYRRARNVQLAREAAANARGEDSIESMAWLGRQALKLAIRAATDTVMFRRILEMPAASRPPKVEAPRKTFRFRLTDTQYAQAVGVLAAAQRQAMAMLDPKVSKEQGKRSVARWVEYHLEQYATTGKIE